VSGAIRVIALAVFRRGDEILFEEGWDSVSASAFARPLGGGVEFGETSVQAVRREMREELGVELARASLLGVIENLFSFNGVPGHEVVFIYETAVEGDTLTGQAEIWGEESPGAEGNALFRLSWRRLNDDSARLVPQGLREMLEAAWGPGAAKP
jgi:ADP-ribose pyrophosphatase YjhB (NUDIX family)